MPLILKHLSEKAFISVNHSNIGSNKKKKRKGEIDQENKVINVIKIDREYLFR